MKPLTKESLRFEIYFRWIKHANWCWESQVWNSFQMNKTSIMLVNSGFFRWNHWQRERERIKHMEWCWLQSFSSKLLNKKVLRSESTNRIMLNSSINVYSTAHFKCTKYHCSEKTEKWEVNNNLSHNFNFDFSKWS